jgi:hypothetical protein
MLPGDTTLHASVRQYGIIESIVNEPDDGEPGASVKPSDVYWQVTRPGTELNRRITVVPYGPATGDVVWYTAVPQFASKKTVEPVGIVVKNSSSWPL